MTALKCIAPLFPIGTRNLHSSQSIFLYRASPVAIYSWALQEKFTTQRFSIQIRTTETKPNPNPNPNTNPNPNPTKTYHLMVYMVLGGELLRERHTPVGYAQG